MNTGFIQKASIPRRRWTSVPEKHPTKKVVYTYKIEYYSAIKRNAFDSVLMRWMNQEHIKQNEVSQKEENKYHILAHIYGI